MGDLRAATFQKNTVSRLIVDLFDIYYSSVFLLPSFLYTLKCWDYANLNRNFIDLAFLGMRAYLRSMNFIVDLIIPQMSLIHLKMNKIHLIKLRWQIKEKFDFHYF